MEFVRLLPFLAIFVLFWVMVVRPASRRQKELLRLQESLQPGQQVMLASGIFGTVRSLSEDRARVEVAAGVELEVMRGAVNRVLEPAASDKAGGTATDPSANGAAGDQP